VWRSEVWEGLGVDPKEGKKEEESAEA